MSLTEFYERYWQRPEHEYSEDVGLGTRPREVLLKAALRTLPRGAEVLDAGCGSGGFAAFLHQQGFTVTGVDISYNAVSYARRKYAGITFHVAALEHGLPFPDGRFAAVWCSEVLEHLFDVHTALSEINRVLQPDGRLILTTPYHGLVKNLIITLKGFDQHYNPYLSHIRFFSRKSLTKCLERAGFRVEQWRGIGRTRPVWKSQFLVCRKVTAPQPPPAIVG